MSEIKDKGGRNLSFYNQKRVTSLQEKRYWRTRDPSIPIAGLKKEGFAIMVKVSQARDTGI